MSHKGSPSYSPLSGGETPDRSPAWSSVSSSSNSSRASDPPSLARPVVPYRRSANPQPKPTPAPVPTFTYTTSESPRGTFRQHFTCNGELRTPIFIQNGQLSIGQNPYEQSSTPYEQSSTPYEQPSTPSKKY